MLKEYSLVHMAGISRTDILTQVFIKPMTLMMTLDYLLRRHFSSRITDSPRKNNQKDVKVHITANIEEGWLGNKSESIYLLYAP